MMTLPNTDLLKAPAWERPIPNEHEREAVRAIRKARLAALREFVEEVFGGAPRRHIGSFNLDTDARIQAEKP